MIDPHYLFIPRPEDPLDAAIRFFGSQVKLGEAIGYTQQAVANWKTRGVPKRARRLIETATDGQIPVDCWGEVRG